MSIDYPYICPNRPDQPFKSPADRSNWSRYRYLHANPSSSILFTIGHCIPYHCTDTVSQAPPSFASHHHKSGALYSKCFPAQCVQADLHCTCAWPCHFLSILISLRWTNFGFWCGLSSLSGYGKEKEMVFLSFTLFHHEGQVTFTAEECWGSLCEYSAGGPAL